MVYTVGHFINGEVVNKTGKESLNIFNPATGEKIGKLFPADKKTCDAAIESAKKALPGWANTPPIKRSKILFKFRELLHARQKELAKIVTLEHGKTFEDALGSIARGLEVVEHNCGILYQMQGSFTQNAATDIDCYTFREPIGIAAGVSPFNFPVMVPLWMMIPAIACGNAFILKPSELDPSAVIFLLELLTEAGIPKGIVTALQGGKETVEYLLASPDIASFTAVASTVVARNIYTLATSSGKRAHTFGGAKNHCVVMPDASLEQTAKAIVGAGFGSAGERCMAISVVVTIGDDIADRLIEKLITLIKKIRIDSGDKNNVDMGPLISKAHLKKVKNAINQGVAEGATLLVDGRDFEHPIHKQGYFLGPSLFDRVTEQMSIYQNEIFGPVLIIVRVNNFEEAINLINRNQYGNGTAIFTNDGFSANQFTKKIQVGMVGINIPIPVPIASHAFGGWKHSSFGDTNMHALESINFYTKRKTITCRWPKHELLDESFTMPIHE